MTWHGTNLSWFYFVHTSFHSGYHCLSPNLLPVAYFGEGKEEVQETEIYTYTNTYPHTYTYIYIYFIDQYIFFILQRSAITKKGDIVYWGILTGSGASGILIRWSLWVLIWLCSGSDVNLRIWMYFTEKVWKSRGLMTMKEKKSIPQIRASIPYEQMLLS